MKSIIALILLILTSCDPKPSFPPKGFVAIKGGLKREGSLGFAFTTPHGQKWYEMYSSKTLAYLKKTNFNQLSFFAEATEVTLRSPVLSAYDLMNTVKKYKNNFKKDNARYKNNKLNITAEDSQHPICVRYEGSVNDYKAANKGNNYYMIMKYTGRACLEPKKKETIIDIFYSIRSVPQLNIQQYANEGEIFINSLKYIE